MRNHFYSQLRTKSISHLDRDQLTLQREQAIYSEGKFYFLHYFEDQQQNGMQTQSTTNDAATWDQIRTAFIDRLSDDRDKYRQRITAENIVRGNKELIKNFYHRVKSAIDKGWPLDPNGTQAERDNGQNQRNAKYIEFTVRGLRATGLKRKAHEYLIEHPNATWGTFQTHITSKDVIYTISSELVPNATSDQNTKLHSLDKQNSLHYSENSKWTKSPNLFLDLRTLITNQDRIWPDSVDTVEEMDTRSCTAELKPMMMRSKDNRHWTTKSAQQFSLMTTKNEGDRTLGLRIIKISVSNPDTETRTTRHPIDKIASTQIGTEPQTQIYNITRTDQATPGTMNHITVSRLSITSMLVRRILILSTTRIFHRATTCLHLNQFNSLTIRDKM